MIGNVYEWVWDRYRWYPDHPEADPTGPDAGPHRMLRGGSWQGNATTARIPFRLGSEPHHSYPDVGLRLALPAR